MKMRETVGRVLSYEGSKYTMSNWKILFISDRRDGGILRHVKCLRECLPPEVETYEIGYGGDEEFAGRNGHDIREFFQIRRVIRDFKPDIVHLHSIPLFMALHLKFFTDIPKVCSLHTPSALRVAKDRHILNIIVQPCYFLAVSKKTWERFLLNYPGVKGEVFYNPIHISSMPCKRRASKNYVVGMVGRFADVKDWPSFVKTCLKIRERRPDVVFQAVGVSREEAMHIEGSELISWLGVRDDAKKIIGGMDILLLTSESEEMPTVILEAFAMNTPVAGFIPQGGVEEIVEMCPESGIWRHDRNCDGLADDVIRLLEDDKLRARCVKAARALVEAKFDAARNCRTQLMEVYRKVVNTSH